MLGWVILIVWLLVVAVLGILFADGIARGKLDALTDVKENIGKDSKVAIIHEPGVLSDGFTACQPFLATLNDYGNVFQVAYFGKRFNAESYAEYSAAKLNAQLSDYDRIVIIGTSMGGLLAFDLRPKLKHSNVSLIAVDTPLSSKDLKSPNKMLAPAAKYLPIGPIVNALVGPIFKKMLVAPKDENIEDGLDKEAIKRNALESLSRWPLSINRDQLAYIHDRGFSQSDFDGFERIVYIRCSPDKNETVEQPQATTRFVQAAGKYQDGTDVTEVIEMDSTHCGYAESPTEANRVFRQALDTVLA